MATGLACRLSRYPYPKRLNAAAQSQLGPEDLWCMYALTRSLPVFLFSVHCTMHTYLIKVESRKA